MKLSFFSCFSASFEFNWIQRFRCCNEKTPDKTKKIPMFLLVISIWQVFKFWIYLSSAATLKTWVLYCCISLKFFIIGIRLWFCRGLSKMLLQEEKWYLVQICSAVKKWVVLHFKNFTSTGFSIFWFCKVYINNNILFCYNRDGVYLFYLCAQT